MNIIKSICTKSDCYKAGKTIKVKGLMLHSVGCPQPKAQSFINKWNKSGANACVHAIIEPDGDVYQLLPWDYRGWHGGGSSNNTYIGVEMTEPNTIKYTSGSSWKEIGDGTNTKKHVFATYKHAVALFAMLCKKFSLNPLADGVIISHSEGYKRGIASNHGDVEHLWKRFNLTMEQFRKDIKKAMKKDIKSNLINTSIKTGATDEKNKALYRVRKTWKDAGTQKGAFDNLANAKKCADENKGYSVFDEAGKILYSNTSFEAYLVKVSLKDLNIRKGPGINYAKTEFLPVGIYTIVEEATGKGATKWGKLKSGTGWISLDYVEKL